MKNIGKIRNIAFFCVISMLILTILICGLLILKSTDEGEKTSGKSIYKSKTVTVNGKEYFPKQDITTIVVMGIDQTGPVTSSYLYTNPGAADVILVVVLNDTNKTMNILSINRDTMTEVPVLGIGGKKAGTSFEQIALSHVYGDGLQLSCENTRNAVSDLLGGINIDYYLSINMDAISIANDAVGGVVVNVKDDFSNIDNSIEMGEQRLSGEQALTFIRSRKGVGDQSNLNRMDRQEEYIKGFFSALHNSIDGSIGSFDDFYNQIEPYAVTDCSLTVMMDLFDKASQFDLLGIESPSGELVQGKEYYEFYVNEEELQELALKFFYAEKNK